MKTTYTVIASMFLLLTFSLANSQSKNTIGNGKVTYQNRTVSESFDKIHIEQGLTVYLSMDTEEKISVETDENLQDIIKTEIKDGLLKIYCSESIYSARHKNIYVSVLSLSEIKTSSGSSLVSENTLITDSIKTKASSGSAISLQVSTNSLVANASSGSALELKGKTNSLITKSSSGSTIDAYKLNSQDVESNASTGSSTLIRASYKLVAKASSGGHISQKGAAKIIEKKTSSGGQVSIKK